MKKVLFLMFLLLLMGLGAAGLKAQVRIGGNTPPSAAAVLDLNASDAANIATGGLVLPRVDLKSNVMQLTNGIANQTGTMVYNVTTTLGRIGVYYWNGNSWVNASLPSTSAADSGKIMMSNGTSIILTTWRHDNAATGDTITLLSSPVPVSFSVIYDGTWTPNTSIRDFTAVPIYIPGISPRDFCVATTGLYGLAFVTAGPNYVFAMSVNGSPIFAGAPSSFRCYRPSV